MMLERLIYTALVDGIELFKANPDAIVEFFETEAMLETAEAEEIRDYFLANPPTVVHGYARSDAKFPLMAITLTSQQTGQRFMGESGGMFSDPEDADFGADRYVTIFNYTYNIIVYAQNPDVVLYYFHMAMHFLIDAFPEFRDCGIFDLNYGGSDMTPDASTTPAGLFMRRLQLSMSRQYTQPLAGSKLGRAWQVQGMHIDREGAVGEDVGGVETHVTIMGVDDV